MSASRFDFDYDEAVAVRRAAQEGGLEKKRESLSYWIEATASANQAPVEVRLIAGEELPVLAKVFPEALQEVYEAGCDLSEDDASEEVRIVGYRCMVMVAQQEGSFAGQVADVLLQLYRDTLQYNTSPAERSALHGSLRSVLFAHPKSTLQSFFYMIESGEVAQQRLLWEFLDGQASKDLEALWKRKVNEDVQAEFIQELFHAIPLADSSCRRICLQLLSRTPLCTGPTPSVPDLHYYVQLLCEESLVNPSDEANFNRCLELLTPAYNREKDAQPDPRWPLLLFCHNPDGVDAWLRSARSTMTSSEGPGEEGEDHAMDGKASDPDRVGPTRLMDWAFRGFVKMRMEHKDPSLAEGVPDYFGMTSLGLDLCKRSLAFMFSRLPAYRTLATISSTMQDIELYLLISYFMWLKFNGRVPSLMDDGDKARLIEIAGLADAGSGRTQSEQEGRVYSNIAIMCRNLSKAEQATEADKQTVRPSWNPLPPPKKSRDTASEAPRARRHVTADARGQAVASGPLRPDRPLDASESSAMDVDVPEPPQLPPSSTSAHGTATLQRTIPTQPRADRNESRITSKASPRSAVTPLAPATRGMSISKSYQAAFPAKDASSLSVTTADAGPSSGSFTGSLSMPDEKNLSLPPRITSSFSVKGHANRSSPVTENFQIAGMASRASSRSPIVTPTRGTLPPSPSSSGVASGLMASGSGMSIFGSGSKEGGLKRKRSTLYHMTDGRDGPQLQASGSMATLPIVDLTRLPSDAPMEEDRPSKRGKPSLADRIFSHPTAPEDSGVGFVSTSEDSARQSVATARDGDTRYDPPNGIVDQAASAERENGRTARGRGKAKGGGDHRPNTNGSTETPAPRLSLLDRLNPGVASSSPSPFKAAEQRGQRIGQLPTSSGVPGGRPSSSVPNQQRAFPSGFNSTSALQNTAFAVGPTGQSSAGPSGFKGATGTNGARPAAPVLSLKDRIGPDVPGQSSNPMQVSLPVGPSGGLGRSPSELGGGGESVRDRHLVQQRLQQQQHQQRQVSARNGKYHPGNGFPVRPNGVMGANHGRPTEPQPPISMPIPPISSTMNPNASRPLPPHMVARNAIGSGPVSNALITPMVVQPVAANGANVQAPTATTTGGYRFKGRGFAH